MKSQAFEQFKTVDTEALASIEGGGLSWKEWLKLSLHPIYLPYPDL